MFKIRLNKNLIYKKKTACEEKKKKNKHHLIVVLIFLYRHLKVRSINIDALPPSRKQPKLTEQITFFEIRDSTLA